MNRILIYIGVFLTGLVFQFSFNQFFSMAGLSPNFLLLFVIYIGLMYGPMAGQLYGFAWGLSWDIFSVDLFGSHAFLLTLMGFLTGMLSRKWNESKLSAQAVLAFIASLAFLFGRYILFQIFSPGGQVFALNYINVIQPFYNVLVTPLVFIAGGIVSVILRRVLRENEN